MNLTETQIFEYATNPEKIIDPRVANTISAFLNGHISDLVNDEWEKRLVASQAKVKLLEQVNLTNAHAKALWEVSDEYKAWQETVNKLRKFRTYRQDVRDRFTVLTGQKRY